MRLDSIECQNFFNHRYTKIDLTQVGSPVLVKGENGAGKSSLFSEALTFAIFGITRLPSVDEAIRNGASEMSVGVRFNLNGQDVEIVRYKKRGKSAKLELTIDGEHVEELLSETQKRIDKMFGLSYNSFLSSIILKQEDADFFVKQKPDERKEIIREILDLGQFKRMEKSAREKRAQLKSEIKIEESAYNAITLREPEELVNKFYVLQRGTFTLDERVKALEGELEAIRSWNQSVTEQLKARDLIIQSNRGAENMIVSLNSKIDVAKVEITRLRSIAHPGNNDPDVITQAEQMIAEIEEEINRLEVEGLQKREEYKNRTKAETIEIKTALEPHVQKLNLWRGKYHALLNSIQEAREFTEIAVCPTCEQKIDHAHRQEIIEKQQAEAATLETEIKRFEEPVRKVQVKLDALSNDEAPWQKEIKSSIDAIINEHQSKKVLLVQARNGLKKRLDQQKQYEMAQQSFDHLTQSVSDMSQSVEAFKAQIQPVPDVTTVIKETTPTLYQLSETKDQVTKVMRAIASVEAEIEQNDAAIARKADLEQILKDKIKLIGLYDKLCVAFSNNGIPAAIIETVLPEIEQTANHFLTRMSQGRLSIQFKTTETMKNGNTKETLDVEVFDGVEWRRFESFSGGEQFRISLSIRLSLSKVLSRRANVDLQLLILDEAATSLDQQGREEFIQTVLSLSQDFSRIILMSHIPELADEFENRITLGKSIDGTKVISS